MGQGIKNSDSNTLIIIIRHIFNCIKIIRVYSINILHVKPFRNQFFKLIKQCLIIVLKDDIFVPVVSSEQKVSNPAGLIPRKTPQVNLGPGNLFRSINNPMIIITSHTTRSVRTLAGRTSLPALKRQINIRKLLSADSILLSACNSHQSFYLPDNSKISLGHGQRLLFLNHGEKE